MSEQHLSDEAVAAHADGVLAGHARDRAARHCARCPECARAVQEQREAAWRLRAAVAPPLPTGLLDRLQTVPQTTELTGPPTTFGPDGSPVLPTTAWPGARGGRLASRGLLGQPMAALVPTPVQHGRLRPLLVTTVATLAVAGAVTAGTVAVAHGAPEPHRPADQRVVHRLDGTGGGAQPLNAFRPTGR